MKIEIILWNVVLYILSVALLILGVQHATFFYSWPPDLSRLVYVPPQTYLIMGFGVYLLLKLSNYVWERGEIFPEED